MISLTIFKLSVLIISGLGRWVSNGGSCWLSSFSLSNLIFVFNMKVSFSILLSRCNHPLSMIAYNLLSLLAKDFFCAWLINITMLYRSKSVLPNACLCLKCKRAYFSTVMAIFQHPFWWKLSPNFQTSVALGFSRVDIHFLCSSGVVELVYFRNGNWSLIPYNNMI